MNLIYRPKLVNYKKINLNFINIKDFKVIKDLITILNINIIFLNFSFKFNIFKILIIYYLFIIFLIANINIIKY